MAGQGQRVASLESAWHRLLTGGLLRACRRFGFRGLASLLGRRCHRAQWLRASNTLALSRMRRYLHDRQRLALFDERGGVSVEEASVVAGVFFPASESWSAVVQDSRGGMGSTFSPAAGGWLGRFMVLFGSGLFWLKLAAIAHAWCHRALAGFTCRHQLYSVPGVACQRWVPGLAQDREEVGQAGRWRVRLHPPSLVSGILVIRWLGVASS